LELLGDGNPGPFFADAGVDCPEELPLAKQLKQSLLDTSDQHCLPLQTKSVGNTGTGRHK
jgi:hypothetical protein